MPLKKSSITRFALGSQATKSEQVSKFADTISKTREGKIEEWFKRAGEMFVQWQIANYRTHKNKPISYEDPFFQDLCLVVGDPRIQNVFVIKGAQQGFSELSISFALFCASELKCSTGFVVEQQRKLQDLVGPRIHPAIRFSQHISQIIDDYRKNTGVIDTLGRDRLITIGGIPITFAFAATSSSNASRIVPAALSSFQADVTIGDEVEAWDPAARSILAERQGASAVRTKPMRLGSTPGKEGGILDVMIRKSSRYFTWNVNCPHCGKKTWLNLFGAVLKQEGGDPMRSEVEGRSNFLDPLGVPLRWSHVCPPDAPLEERIETAYVSCSHCDTKFDSPHLMPGEYICAYTGVTLHQFLPSLQEEERVEREVAIEMNRIATQKCSIPERLGRIIYAPSPQARADAYQQGFGIAISIGANKIPMYLIQECVGRQERDSWGDEPDFVILGIDQGQAAHFGCVQYWWMPDYEANPLGKRESEVRNENPELFDLARCKKAIVWSGQVMKTQSVIDLAEEWNADVVGIDQYPEVQQTAELTLKFGMNREPDSEVQAAILRIARQFRFSIQIPPSDRFTLSLLDAIKAICPDRETFDTLVNDFYTLSLESLLEQDRTALARSRRLELVSIVKSALVSLGMHEQASDFSYWKCSGFVIPFCQRELSDGTRYKYNNVTVIHGMSIDRVTVDRTSQIDSVRDRICEKRQSFPDGTTYEPGDRDSLIYQYVTSSRIYTSQATSSTGLRAARARWQENPGEPDHYLHADAFGESAAATLLCHPDKNSQGLAI
jgi:hypothetical protein